MPLCVLLLLSRPLRAVGIPIGIATTSPLLLVEHGGVEMCLISHRTCRYGFVS